MSKKDRLGQSGMVSILVTMIMIIVMTLIVLGFSQVARHNQREALDRQLASQAFYAAESGVNDVLGLVSAGTYKPATDATQYLSSCQGASSFIGTYLSGQSVLNPPANIAYTCLLVNPVVPNIVESNLTPDTSVVVPIKLNMPSALQFSWSDTAGTPHYLGCPTVGTVNDFVPSTSWGGSNCNYGILRIDLFDADANGTSTDPTTLASHTASIYFVPHNSPSGTPVFGGAQVISAKCSSGNCVATLSSASIGNHQNYYVRMTMIYENAQTVTISSPSNATFSGAQLMVDSTGKAQDELKRIQVRIPLYSGNGTTPGYALQSAGNICKRYITLGNASDPGALAGNVSVENIPDDLCSSP